MSRHRNWVKSNRKKFRRDFIEANGRDWTEAERTQIMGKWRAAEQAAALRGTFGGIRMLPMIIIDDFGNSRVVQ